MSKIDLIDDYLANRLDESSRMEFEKRMDGDPQLKADVEFQKQIVESIKAARIADLKSMLSKVPVGGGSGVSAGKITLATLTAGLVGTLIYFSLQTGDGSETAPTTVDEISVEQPIASPESKIEVEQDVTSEPATDPIATTPEIKEEQKKAGAPNQKTESPAVPKVDVLDPTEEITDGADENETMPAPPEEKPTVSASKLEVETVMGEKAYPFHYQFSNGKLVLYGPFDSSLYEIIEINGNHHSVFLYYKDGYYSLNEKENKIVPLILIRDDELLTMLKKYRNK